MDTNLKSITGVGASPGVVKGRAFVWRMDISRRADAKAIDVTDVDAEIGRFQTAVNKAIDDVESLLRQGKETFSATERDLLEMQAEMLSDPQLHSDVVRRIKGLTSAVSAVWVVCDQFVAALSGLDNTYLAERAADLRSCADHICRHLRDDNDGSLPDIPAHSIIVVDDISPLEALSLDLSKIAGMVTRQGGSTSHAAILARAKEIPAVVGCGEALSNVAHGVLLFIDGSTGEVIIEPSRDIASAWEERKKQFEHQQAGLRAMASAPTMTSDGVEIRLLANISGEEDMAAALPFGAQGAGLFRTEMVFMKTRQFPSEEEQLEQYQKVLTQAEGRPVTIRTLDIGGDKPLSYFNIPPEENPFLGYRAIRISLDQPQLLKVQLRALLRAGITGDLRVMFPMIGSIGELRRAKDILAEAKSELRERGIPFKADMRVGMMIETPAAAMLADIFAKEVDFFSIGTNDLCQYTLAVDRGNEKITALYDHFHPSVLRLIQYIIVQADANNIDVSLCGEMAADPQAALLLVGMGLRTFSMSAPTMLEVKRIIVQNSLARAKEMAAAALALDDATTIRKYLDKQPR